MSDISVAYMLPDVKWVYCVHKS